MKLYSIRGWNEHFENNRSRTVKDLAWVAIPNRHDGEHFSIIMQAEHGAEIYAAWVLMLQVASRCQPRGTLLRDNKKPHTMSTLSVKTRAPENWFVLAFEFLEKHTDWLDVKDLQEGCQPPVSLLPQHCQPPDEEGKGREGKGENGPRHFPEAETPSWEEWWSYCQSPNCGLGAEWYARDKFQAAEAEQWKGKQNWRAHAVRCKNWWQQDGSLMAPKKANGAPSKARVTGWIQDANYDSRTPEEKAEQERRRLEKEGAK